MSKKPENYLRYYLHGDQHASSKNSYFCARCDFFFEKEHFFETRHVSEDDIAYHLARYKRGKSEWERRLRREKTPMTYRGEIIVRPSECTNVFDSIIKGEK